MAKSKKKNINRQSRRWIARSERADVPSKCWFCEHSILPDYKDIEILQSFLSPRGKILSKQITATCAKHQRKLARSVKIARQLALLR